MSASAHRPELFVMRHGETFWNREGRFQGDRDSALTRQGRAQARDMGARLAGLGVSAETHDFIASPQGRAIETARIMAAGFGAAVRPEPRLREIDMGRWTGLLQREIHDRWPGPPGESVVEFYARAPDGEPFESLWSRVGAFLDSLSRPAVVVTHGFTSRFLRTRAMGLDLSELSQLPGGQGVIFRIAGGLHEGL